MTEALLEFARKQFAWTKPDSKTGKSPLQIEIEVIEQTSIVRTAFRNRPRCPPDLQYLWDWYEDLSNARGAGFSVNAIAWVDMLAYFTMVGVRPQRWEVRTIRAIDTAYMVSRSTESVTVAGSAGSIRGN